MRALLFAVTAGCTAVAGPSAPTPAGSLIALSKRDRTLAIVEPTTLRVVAKLPVGDDPHEVIASEDGKLAYVSNYGFGAFHSLAVIDLVGQRALASIDLGALRGPHGLTAVGGEIWFTAEASKAIGRFDPATKQLDLVLGTGQDRTHMVYVSADQQRIVTSNVSSATMTVMDHVAPGQEHDHPPGPPPGGGPPRGPHGAPGGDWHETVIAVGHGSEGFDVAPDGKEAWVANAQDGTISIFDPSTKQVIATLPVDAQHGNRLKFTIDGKRVLVSGGPDVTVYDVAARAPIKKVPIGRGGAGIVMQPDGARAYVADSQAGKVVVIDLATLTVVGTIDVGGEPDGLAWAARAH